MLTSEQSSFMKWVKLHLVECVERLQYVSNVACASKLILGLFNFANSDYTSAKCDIARSMRRMMAVSSEHLEDYAQYVKAISKEIESIRKNIVRLKGHTSEIYVYHCIEKVVLKMQEVKTLVAVERFTLMNNVGVLFSLKNPEKQFIYDANDCKDLYAKSQLSSGSYVLLTPSELDALEKNAKVVISDAERSDHLLLLK